VGNGLGADGSDAGIGVGRMVGSIVGLFVNEESSRCGLVVLPKAIGISRLVHEHITISEEY
jgi:hypothetical protein